MFLNDFAYEYLDKIFGEKCHLILRIRKRGNTHNSNQIEYVRFYNQEIVQLELHIL